MQGKHPPPSQQSVLKHVRARTKFYALLQPWVFKLTSGLPGPERTAIVDGFQLAQDLRPASAQVQRVRAAALPLCQKTAHVGIAWAHAAAGRACAAQPIGCCLRRRLQAVPLSRHCCAVVCQACCATAAYPSCGCTPGQPDCKHACACAPQPTAAPIVRTSLRRRNM